ncbi:MAG: GerMN domain-containing protein [Candidatus Staskawiczbacteria bacterium]|nr:GerMN domain-containing protein [Candidatus Staskawiczbacteria bacterium]
MSKNIWFLAILAVVIIVSAVVLLLPNNKPNEVIDTSEVKVSSVKSGDTISNPLIVEGEAGGGWFFEASFPIKITDENGNVLGVSYVQAQSNWMTEDFVSFKGEVSYVSEAGGNGFLVLMKDNPSGLPENDKEIKIPVILSPTEMTTVKVFFNNSKMDPDFSCNKVFSVDRTVIKTQAIARSALQELLKGPTETEKNAGFFTSINPGVLVQSLTIENGTAKVDFNDQLEYQVGGSCRVSAVRSEIIETLKQFPTVNNVVISINGRTEDILQP